jgi:hypothetical protein
MDQINLNLIRESYWRVIYTYTAHNKDYYIKSNIVRWIKRLNVVITFVVLSLIVLQMKINNEYLLRTTIIVTFFQVSFLIYQLSFNHEELKEKHKQAANTLWIIKEDLLWLIADIMNKAKTEEEIIKGRNSINKELGIIYKNTPNTSKKAYKQAQLALKIEEEQTFSEEEIDYLLPKNLRLHEKS